jgi:hypothetical protein
MSTREIPRTEWPEFFKVFSRVHQGWRVTVEELGRELGAQTEAAEMPMQEITAEKGGITMILGPESEATLTHVVNDPQRIYLGQDVEGADEALEIERGDGGKTLLVFRATVTPERLDGVVKELEPAKR